MMLGIDPGLSGAFVIYNVISNEIVSAFNIPTLSISRNNKVKRSVDIHRLLNNAREIRKRWPDINATMELVGAMPKQGVSSVFSFGRSDGIIETAVVAAEIPLSKITPQAWKRALACPAEKDGAILRANQLMPKSSPLWTPERGVRTKEDCYGIAEGALIAYFAEKMALDRSLVAA